MGETKVLTILRDEIFENIVGKRGNVGENHDSMIKDSCGKGILNPFPNKPWFLHVCSTSFLKTLREKEKLLVTSNFSFSYSVFSPFEELPSICIKIEIVICKLFLFGRVKNLLFGKGFKQL